jgi:hypothetical protein
MALFTALVFSLFSCRDTLALNRPEDYASADQNINAGPNWKWVFESYWTGMNNNYLFWDIDPTDWDQVYKTYKPKFAALDIYTAADNDTAYEYFQDITKDLVDGHYFLKVNDRYLAPLEARYWKSLGADLYKGIHTTALDQSEYRVETSSNIWGVSDSVWNTLLGVSWKKGRVTTYKGDYGNIEGGFRAVTGIHNSSVGPILYVHFSGFSVLNIMQRYAAFTQANIYTAVDDYKAAHTLTDDDLLVPHPVTFDANGNITGYNNNPKFNTMNADPEFSSLAPQDLLFILEVRNTRELIQQFLDDLKSSDIKGLIVDLRGNGGGEVRDLTYLWGRLINQNLTFAYHRSKLGEGRLDHTPWMPYMIYPAPAADRVTASFPVVALVNKGSVSCAEMSAMVIKTLPKGYVVGGATWGGQGGLTDNRVFNGGQFNGGGVLDLVYTPSVEVKYLDGHNYEGQGFPPDIPVAFNYSGFMANRDARLEAAIECVVTHQ